MKHFKSVLAMLLALVMILSCVATAFAADKTDAEDIAGAEKPAATLRQLKGYKSESFLGSNSYKYAADETVRAIVILSGDPEADVAEANSERAVSQHLTLMKQHESVRKAMSGIKFDLKYDFTALTNGFSCDVAYGDLDKIAALDGVEAVYIANHYAEPVLEKAPETRMASSNYYFTGIDDVLDYYGADGSGLIIAVLDTGLNTTHEAFNDADGWCAVNGVLTEADVSKASMPGKYINPKVPFTYDYADFDDDVTDYNGHGTHVSGIATGSTYSVEEEGYTFLGAASGAQLVNMKIFHDDEPGTNSDIYFAALDDAYRLGVDVINMSIGAQNGFTYDAELETEVFGNIYERLNNAGIVLSVAAGNEYSMAEYSPVGYVGPEYQDYGTVGSPATYEGNTSVASLENYLYKTNVITTDAGSFPYTDSSDEKLWLSTFGDQTATYVIVPDPADASAISRGYAEDYEGVDVTGKIAVVKRGDITFEEKVEFAANAGAIGCIVVNNQPGVISMAIETYEVPAVSVEASAETALVNASVYELTAPTEKEYAENANAGLMSDFSNWGTTPMLTLDPAITSVGGMIYSAVNTGDADYDVYSGTSMATPNYAGTIATVMQYLASLGMEKKERADAATALLESTAEIMMDADGYPYSPRKQGAGLANAATALSTYDESGYITSPLQELGDDPDRTGHFNFTVEIKNDSTYDLFYLPEAYLLYDYVANAGSEAQPYWVNTQTSDFAYLGNEGYASVTYELDGTDVTDGFALAIGETAKITVDIQLDDDIKAYFDETFPNGNFVEGFVCFNDVENDAGEVIYYDEDYYAYKLDENGAYQVDDWDGYAVITDGEGNKIYYEGDLADLSPYTYYTTHATLLAYYGDWTDGDVLEAADFRDYIDAEYWVNTTAADEDGNTYADYGYTGLDLLDYYTSPNMGYSAVFYEGAPQSLVWYFGDNLYDYVPFYEEHLNITTDDNDADGYYANGFYLEPYQLRNCRHLIMTVTNAETGEVYFVDDTEYLPKAYYDTDNGAWGAAGAFYWDGTDADGNFVPSGTKVSVVFDAVLPYGETEKKDIWSFDVLVDSTAPVIESAEYDAEAKTVTVTAKDESYLADILIYAVESDESLTLFDALGFSSDKAGESFTATFDVSILLDNGYDTVAIGALDYATNEKNEILELKECQHENTEIRDAVDATCTEDGYTGDTYCLDCGEKIAEGEVIPAAGHTPGEPVQENLVPATYSKAGSYDEVVYCTVCKAELSRESRVVDPIGYGKCYVKDFTDCPDDWYHEAIDFMVDAKLMNGVGSGKFDPNGTMTRGMIVTVLYRMAGSPDIEAPSTFKDVKADEWYADAIAWAQKNEVVNGYSPDKFGPNDPVTREQIAAILWRYEKQPEAKEADMSKFSDTAKISAYAKDAMTWAVGEGILSGDNGKLKPTDNATRAEFACMIMRYMGGVYACENLKDKYK
ncbi:MAG: S8 family serine peptidase [Oscillospiraceae bacterium]|nr:S8 family serine peptidase [Oscillospiraceae bacterium]